MTGTMANCAHLLTPPGTGAIAVIRVSGAGAVGLVDEIFHVAGGRRLSERPADRLCYGRLMDGDQTIDDVVAVVVDERAQTSVDITAHGGVRIVERILELLERHGAPLSGAKALPGTVWTTANAIERDALDCLVRVTTERAVRLLGWQRRHLATALLQVAERWNDDPADARQSLSRMASAFPVASRIIDGARVAILGPPNSGKSTLFNRLVGRSAAIVSDRAGTTRDWVSADVEMGGIPVSLIDTAGHHAAAEQLEAQAIGTGGAMAEAADLRLIVLDGSRPLQPAALDLARAFGGSSNALLVISQSDRGLRWDEQSLPANRRTRQRPTVRASAVTGAGIDDLTTAVAEALGEDQNPESAPSLFCRRQMTLAGEMLSVVQIDAAAARSAIRQVIG